MKKIRLLSLVLLAVGSSLQAQDYHQPGLPRLSQPDRTGRVTFDLYPAAERWQMFSGSSLSTPLRDDTNGVFGTGTWTPGPGAGSLRFHRLGVTTLSSNQIAIANLLSKITYGPTPDLLDRLAVIGPDAYLAEQLAPETITERAKLANTNIARIESKFGAPSNYIISATQSNTGPGTGESADLQAWLVMNAVYADRQLHEVLTQFWENHFVTEAGKSANFFVGLQYRNGYPNRAAGEWEWREVSRWRAAMLSPDWTFHDLLRISAESPAMINYLDTATSRGDPPNVPNENYSRELMELFTMGVDNGYDQNDIVALSPVWTGWRFDLVTQANAGNPFAPRTNVRIDPAGPNAFTNLLGVWTTSFRPQFHATGAKTVFAGKTVPARFGEPYVSRLYAGNAVPGLYELRLPTRTGTNGIQDGYDVVRHLSNLPFTQEFISVKLCRLFVHDEFRTGYNYLTDSSPEAQLVRACMAAWDANQGRMRPVLKTIFDSALFRGHGGGSHKVKTPLEYCVSAVRALRQSTNGSGLHGTWTANTDGYGITFSPGGGQTAGNASALMRIGSMSLFDRQEPDGYPEAATGWANAGGFVERMRFVSSFLKSNADTNKNDQNLALINNQSSPVVLLQLRLPAPALRDAGQVSDMFLRLFYPGEGRANLLGYRQLAIDYLNTGDDGTTASAFAGLNVSAVPGSAYDTRVRSLVGMLLSLPRFQEQ